MRERRFFSIRIFQVVLGLSIALPLQLVAADFRESDWGDTVEQVRAVETAPFHHYREDELVYTDSSIEGIRGGILYLFERGYLVRAVYVSRDGYEGGAGVLEAYERMREHLDSQLGLPGEERKRWIDESLRDAPERLAEAISLEHVRVATGWTVGDTRIELVMTGKDGGVFLRALFQPTR